MKTILITGATSGFGRAMAERFAKDGAKLILTGRREERLKELQKLGSHIQTIALDMRDRKAVEKAFSALKDIDVLVNNAGLALGLGQVPDISMDQWDQMIDTNIKGVTYATQAILPGMIKRNNGYIINIGSTAGNYPYPGGNVYGATKAFVKQFSLNLRADLLGKNIRVTNLEPGMAETEFSLVRFSGDKKKADDVYKGLKPLQPEDIAELVHYCVNLPAHVNINRLEVMPTNQAFGPFAIHRS